MAACSGGEWPACGCSAEAAAGRALHEAGHPGEAAAALCSSVLAVAAFVELEMHCVTKNPPTQALRRSALARRLTRRAGQAEPAPPHPLKGARVLSILPAAEEPLCVCHHLPLQLHQGLHICRLPSCTGLRPLFISEPCQRVVGPGMAQRVQATWQVVHLEACIESRRSGPAAPVVGVDNMGSGDSWPSRGRTDGTTLRLLGPKAEGRTVPVISDAICTGAAL